MRVAAGDLFGTNRDEIVAAAGSGGGPQVGVFDGFGQLLSSFYAFAPGFTGGVSVATAPMFGSKAFDIICGAGAGGGPQVTVYNVNAKVLASFYAMAPGFKGGVRVGVAVANGEYEIVTSAGSGGGPQVAAFDSFTLAVLSSFYAYGSGVTSGVFVA